MLERRKDKKSVNTSRGTITKEAIEAAFSKEAKNYDLWAKPQKAAAKKLNDFVCNELVDILGRQGIKILDVGCGTGLLTHKIMEKHKEAKFYGLDISKNMLEEYAKLKPMETKQSSMEEIPYVDKYFDITLSSFALHWTNIDKVLHECIRVSKYGFGISVPVEGSVKAFNYPFPQIDEVLKIVYKYTKKPKALLSRIDIPFKGLDIVRYFKHTGVSNLNPKKEDIMYKKRGLESVVFENQNQMYYIMLYLTARL